jgi:hypothetical protein
MRKPIADGWLYHLKASISNYYKHLTDLIYSTTRMSIEQRDFDETKHGIAINKSFSNGYDLKIY